MQHRYIAIEGNIGAGKTTLANLLAEHFQARLITEEFADNTFLPKFYLEPERYAFPLELSFLADRYKQLKDQIASPDLFGQMIITDYLFIKSKLFARVNLNEAEYELFSRVFDIMDLHLRQPDVLIFLHAPLATLKERIVIRGRSYEQNISWEYLQRVEDIYESYLGSLQIPIIRIDTAAFDFRWEGKKRKTLLDLLSMPLEPKIHYLEFQ